MLDLKTVMAEIEAAVPEGGDWCSVEKAQTLASIVVGLRPDVVVELGVWMGGSAIPIAIALRALASGQLVAVDAWSAEVSVQGRAEKDVAWWGETIGQVGHDNAQRVFLRRLTKHRITADHCVVIQQSSADAAVPAVIDVLHLDANCGPQVVHDVGRWAPAVRVGGVFVLNNLDWHGGHVRRAHDRARAMGFVDLFALDSGVVMQRAHAKRLFHPAFSPTSCYVLPDPEEELRYYRLGGAPEARLIDWAAQLVGPDKSFVDVGADVGAWSQHLSRSCAHAHAFEPRHPAYESLRDGLRAAGIGSVVCHNVLLGEAGRQLDDYDLGHVGLIKIDAVDRAFKILRGAPRTLALYRPRILLTARASQAEHSRLLALLEGQRYVVQAIPNWPQALLATAVEDPVAITL